MKEEIRSLLCQASQATSLQEIADFAYEILGNPIFVEDRAQIKLAVTRNVTIDDPCWQEEIVHGNQMVSPSPSQLKERNSFYRQSMESHMPIITTQSHVSCPCMIKTIMVGNVHVGTVVCPGYKKPFEDGDVELMEIISSFIKAYIERNRLHLGSNKYAVENLLIRLLNGETITRETMTGHIHFLNWHENSYTYLMAICSEAGTTDSPYSLQDICGRIKKVSDDHTIIYSQTIIRLLNTDHVITDWANEFPNMAELLRERSLIAGISKPIKNLSRLSDYYRQAQRMLEIASTLKNNFLFIDYDSHGIYDMMKLVPENQDLRQFCHTKILQMEKYDRNHHTDLLPTLHIYLENLKSISKTAELMNLHRNTVYYRIKRCYEILDTSIEDGDEVFSFIFSLRIIEYDNKKTGYYITF